MLMKIEVKLLKIKLECFILTLAIFRKMCQSVEFEDVF